ncbi:MAG: S8 family serine peptidase [Aureispira sp.]
MRIVFFCISWFFLVGIGTIRAQNREVLVQFASPQQAKQFFAYRGTLPSFTYNCLSQRLQIYSLESPLASILLEDLQQHPTVLACQYNSIVQWRNTLPNDPLGDRQWALDSLGVPSVWEQTKGGTSPNGDQIVCGVIDGSFDVQHEDLVDNIWHNQAEIPNNGLDDDQNGYVDDVTGWQVVFDTDQHDYGPTRNHGTSVLGIIGARGNNGKGATGINQKVQLLLVSAHTANEITRLSNVIEAYSYILEMRELYNSSNGQAGAYVVAVNASWGIDFEKADNHPIWCALFDQLGAAGILSVAATTNTNTNIDKDGDMPCTCSSPYLIAVSESDREHDPKAGYGRTHLDLFSIGQNYTTRWGNRYGEFGGTSAAAPHVTGAIALLYSYPNTNWGALQQSNPSAAALLVKNSLLRGAIREKALSASVAGGRLHIGQAFQKLSNYFEAPSRAGFMTIFPNPTSNWVTIEFAHTKAGEHRYTLYNALGQAVLQESLFYDLPSTRYWTISMGDLSAGAYRLILQAEGQYYQQTIIKQAN